MNPFRILLIALTFIITLPAVAKPVEIDGLTATRMPDHTVIVAWTTEKEGKDDYFEIERSQDGKGWITIAVAFAGTGIENNSYEYIDKKMGEASLYYRIRQRTDDGKYSFSSVATVKGETRAAASILFSDNNISIRLYGGVTDPLEITLLDDAGHILRQKTYGNKGIIIRFSVADLVSGSYTINVRDALGLIGTKKLVLP